MLVRDAVARDAGIIASIYRHEVLHGTASYEVDPPSVAEVARRMAHGIDAGHPWLVAVDDGGAVAGYAYASSFRARPGYRWTVEDSVYVAPTWQGHGIGRRLLDALIERCTALGFRQMVAVIGDAANRGSIVLHERAGFIEVARFPGVGRKHGRWLTNVQMLRALGEGAASAPFAESESTA